MTKIAFGSTAINTVQLGATQAKGVYLGSTKIWSAAVPTFDAIGAGQQDTNSGNYTWNHPGGTSPYALLSIVSNHITNPLSSATYGGTLLPLLGSIVNQNSAACLYFYGAAGCPSGAQTVAINQSVACITVGNTLTATGVSSVSALQTVAPAPSGALSQSVSCAANQLIAQSFADIEGITIKSPAGGTPQWQGYWNGATANCFMTISTATASTTFTASDQSVHYMGAAVVFS